MARFAAILASLIVLLGALQSAQAAQIIAYSPPDGSYGWCTGYAENYAESCAHRQCASAGGTSCQLVADCPGGWMAIAKSADQKTVGVGTACGGGDPYDTRVEALASCMVAANALCWTDLTLDARGNVQPKDQNRGFDVNFYTQVLLTMRGYKLGRIDGNFGSASTQALEAFQTDVGLKSDGVPTDDVVGSLLAVDSGVHALVQVIQQMIVATRTPQTSAKTYGNAVAPSKAATLPDDLASASPEQQRLAVATILSIQKTRCTIPATDAVELPGTGGGAWNVTCTEGQYTLLLGGDTVVVTPGLSSAAAPDDTSSSASAVSTASSTAMLQTSAAPPSGDGGMTPPMPGSSASSPGAAPAQQKIILFVSGAGLETACAAAAANPGACIAYVQGVVDTFVTLAALDGRTSGFCMPDGETGPQLVQIVGDYLAGHPELKEIGGAAVVQQALAEKLPCKTQ